MNNLFEPAMMTRLIRVIGIGAFLLTGIMAGRAFSLLGVNEDWQTPELGYWPPGSNPVGVYGEDIGGPQNLGEEYRYNIPTIFYAYDSSFLDYFGQKGVESVEKAVAIFNALPRVSDASLNLLEFPMETQKINYRASALGMLDLKSAAMGMMLEELGLAHSERYAWTLRNREDTPAGCPIYNFRIIKRTFDPVTWTPTSYVNGTLYTYLMVISCDPAWSDAREVPVDPTAISHSSVSAWPYGIQIGGFYTGLTRDDFGGLRYLYRANNYNVESLPPGSFLGFGTAGGGTGGGWIPVSPPATNEVVDPTDPTDPGTPQPAFVGLRPGVEKVTFSRVAFDSVLGNTFRAFTNAYNTTVVTNGRAITQSVRRPVFAPDLVFSAADFLDGLAVRTVPTWETAVAPPGGLQLNGPGVMTPGINIAFSKIGPAFGQTGGPFIGEDTAIPRLVWSSFDGSTNAPIIFPNSISIQELEAQVLGRR